jgi:hypothetical protein
MKSRALLACLVALAGASPAFGVGVNLDYLVGLDDMVAVVGDDFDNSHLDTPPWIVVGTPGPEAGSGLSLNPGDMLLAGFQANPQNKITALARVNTLDLGSDGAIALLLFGEAPGDILALALIPGAAIMLDGSGPIFASPFSAAAPFDMMLSVTPDGTVWASIAGASVYDGPVEFEGGVAGLGFIVVPEPATAGVLGLGLLALAGRRRRR